MPDSLSLSCKVRRLIPRLSAVHVRLPSFSCSLHMIIACLIPLSDISRGISILISSCPEAVFNSKSGTSSGVMYPNAP